MDSSSQTTRTGRPWSAADIPDQAGRTFVVTGANSGLGLEVTRRLAERGAHVVMAVRNPSKGRAAERELRAAQPDASLELRNIDLADLDSVRRFVAELLAQGRGVDVLINNAGVLMPPHSLSPQGHEIQFAANHLGHFALTGLLLNTIGRGRDPRVVPVTSFVYKSARIRFDDLTGERRYSPSGFYGQSKLANALFGLELDRRLRAAGLPIRSVLSHPGYAKTPIHGTGGNRLIANVMRVGNRLAGEPVERAALHLLYAATAPQAQGGQLIGPDGKGEKWGDPTVLPINAAASDIADARRLWEVSEELTGVTFPFAGG